MCGQIHAPVALPRRDFFLLSALQEVGWDPEPVLTFWRSAKFLTFTGNRTPVLLSIASHWKRYFFSWISHCGVCFNWSQIKYALLEGDINQWQIYNSTLMLLLQFIFPITLICCAVSSVLVESWKIAGSHWISDVVQTNQYEAPCLLYPQLSPPFPCSYQLILFIN